MRTTNARCARAASGHAVAESVGPLYLLHLYVAGITPRSARAIANVKELCQEHLPGRYDLQVIDIHTQPVRTKAEEIVAVPTLIKKWPLPVRRITCDLADRERVLIGLDLKPPH